jgi:NAD(P)-dependent dehydrogenase (short-subunit alcohol dehydrogenase family)
VARRIREGGGEAVFIRPDVSRADEAEALVRGTVEAFGRLDFACNDAGMEGESDGRRKTMDAYTVAREMLGGMELTPMQVAQLRAIDHEHQQRLFALVHAEQGGPARAVAAAEVAALRASLQSAVLGILTAGQRARLGEGAAAPR